MATNLDIAVGLAGHNTAFQVWFQEAYANAKPGIYEVYTQRIDAQHQQTITAGWLANTPLMELWDGARVFKELRNYTQTITYKKYAATMPLKRDMVDHDRSGVVSTAIQNFVNVNVTSSFSRFVTTAFDSNSGAGPTGFDDTALFSASHPHGPSGAVQGNLAAGSNLSHATLATAEAAGMALVEENGEPLGIQYNVMRVGPLLKRRAQELISADRVVIINSDGQMDTPRETSSTFDVVGGATRSNVWQGDMTLVVDERVTTRYTTLIDTNKGIKPMVLFVTRAPEPVNQTDMDAPERFNNDNYIYGVESDFGIAAGHWYAAYRMTGTA